MSPPLSNVRRLYRLSSKLHCQILARSSTRPFTQNSSFLVLTPLRPRPQLPFLHHSHRPVLRPQVLFQVQLARLLSTETKQYLKTQLFCVVRWTGYIWAFAGLVGLVLFGVTNEILERRNPSPGSWSFVSRWYFRVAKARETPDPDVGGWVDWASTGQWYNDLLKRLEDPNIDGKGLTSQLGADEGAIYVEGVGQTGFSIEDMPEEWRRGYYEVLRGNARAAEHLDTWLRDKARNVAFPSQVVIGPSNPRPKPVPFGAISAPREEDCEPAFAPPHVFYMKILTTQGFGRTPEARSRPGLRGLARLQAIARQRRRNVSVGHGHCRRRCRRARLHQPRRQGLWPTIAHRTRRHGKRAPRGYSPRRASCTHGRPAQRHGHLRHRPPRPARPPVTTARRRGRRTFAARYLLRLIRLRPACFPAFSYPAIVRQRALDAHACVTV